jgi:hypothetical protein
MKCLKLMAFCLAIAAVTAAGCTPKKDNKPAPANGGGDQAGSGEHAPHGAGPNGGVVFDLGQHHAEFTVDHGKKECTILVLDADGKTPMPVAASELTVNINDTKTADGTPVSAMTLTLKPVDEKDGKATKFVGTDEGIGNVADFAGTVVADIDGKPAQGEFKE